MSNHHSGGRSAATVETSEFKMMAWINAIVQAIGAVKGDEQSPKLESKFFEQAKARLDIRFRLARSC